MPKGKQKQLEGPCYVPTGVAIKRLGISSRTLTNWRNAGEIVAFQTKGGRWRYDVESYVAGRLAAMRARVERRATRCPETPDMFAGAPA